MENTQSPAPAAPSVSIITKKDYTCAAFIGICFGLFSIPILQNIKLPFLPLGVMTYVGLVVFFFVLATVAIWLASIVGKYIPVAFQFAKFAAVGAFNSFLDWGVLNVLMSATLIERGYGYAGLKGISFVVANISSYFWNKYWTFNQNKESNAKEVGSFIIVSVIGLLINMGVAFSIVYLLGDPNAPAGDLAAKRIANIGALTATIVALFWNFVGYKFFVFKR